MKACSSNLNTHIGQGQTTLATLFKVTRRPDGVVLGFTDHDVDILFSAVNYLSTSSYNRFNLNEKANAEQASTELTGAIDSVITRADLEARLYDYAQVQLLLVNYKSLTDGAIILATGGLGPVTIEEYQFRVEVRGMSYPLTRQAGEICGPNCRVDFGSAKCAPGGALADGTTINSLLQSGTVSTTDGSRTMVVTGISNLGKPLDGGLLTFLTGSNIHLSVEVKTVNFGTNTITLAYSSILTIAPGDTFKLQVACDKLFQTCSATYLNGVNFQAEPHVPGNDHTLAYPDYVAPHT